MRNIILSPKATFAFLLLTVFCCFTEQSLAQRDPNLISSRNYLGIEVGINDSWLAGANNFFWTYSYPYSDDPQNPVVGALPFANLGSGIGFHIAGTLDLSFTNFLGLQAKLFYRSNSFGKTLQRVVDCAGIQGGSTAPATIEDNYSMSLNYFGLSAALRLQIIPESFYGTVGLEYGSLVSNRFSGYEKIISSTNGCQYLTSPNNLPTNQTEIIIPEAPAASDFLNTSQFLVKLGIGTFIELGTSHWVLTPELNLGIPLSSFFQSPVEGAYKNGYPTNNPNDPVYPAATTPKLWYASLSVALKFPFGAMSKADIESEESSSSNSSNPENPGPPPGYADLKGKVTDAKTGKPLRAKMTVTDLGDNQVVSTTPTDDSGKYSVRVKAPGKYSVTADADDHLFGSTSYDVDPEGRILRGNHDIKLPESNGRTRLLTFFETDKNDLARSSYPELDRIVSLMQANPTMEVEIAGYADSRGTPAYNMDLSVRRANAVRDYLLRKGIAPNRVVAKGYGEENPIASNDTEEGRAENRRVEFVVLHK